MPVTVGTHIDPGQPADDRQPEEPTVRHRRGDQLGASLARCVGGQAYGIDSLRSDLVRFTFLLGSNDGEHSFSPEH